MIKVSFRHHLCFKSPCFHSTVHDSGLSLTLKLTLDFQDSSILVLNKPPKVPMKGHLPVHNSMDVLAAAALSYGNKEGPKLVRSLCCFKFLSEILSECILGYLKLFVYVACGHRFID
jgi:hypothetical protein